MSSFILLENRRTFSKQKTSIYFTDPVATIICHHQQDIERCLDEINTLRKQGYFLSGFISYEAGYALNKLETLYAPVENALPLIHFFAFQDALFLTQYEVNRLLDELCVESKKETMVYDIHLSPDEDEYKEKIIQLKNHLYEGDSYQVNYTGKYHFKLQGNPIKLYKTLRERQKVEYGAFIHTEQYDILCLSPELFFSKKEHHIISKPMKGTLPRSHLPECDIHYQNQFKENEKLCTENLIIVDLLRNDLSRIARTHSLRVSKLLQVETYETLHQMISCIEVDVQQDITLKALLSALFPCGSITGAPKRKTMEIIHRLETKPRGLYTGTIGYITPNNDMCFNVAIRTLITQNGEGELGVGGGIIYDSNVQEEYQELQLKAQFFTHMDAPFKLIESIKCTPYGYIFLKQHLTRLKASAILFGFNYHEREILDALKVYKKQLPQTNTYKIRLVLAKNGSLFLEHIRLESAAITPSKVRIILEDCTESSELLLQHKTTDSRIRSFYQEHRNKHPEYNDVLFINQKECITESSIANVFIQSKGKILTPALHCGLLPGIMRQRILQRYPTIEETEIPLPTLLQAEKIWLCNSVRGIYEVFLCKK